MGVHLPPLQLESLRPARPGENGGRDSRRPRGARDEWQPPRLCRRRCAAAPGIDHNVHPGAAEQRQVASDELADAAPTAVTNHSPSKLARGGHSDPNSAVTNRLSELREDHHMATDNPRSVVVDIAELLSVEELRKQLQ